MLSLEQSETVKVLRQTGFQHPSQPVRVSGVVIQKNVLRDRLLTSTTAEARVSLFLIFLYHIPS